MFIGQDMPASIVITQEKMGWNPAGPSLIADLERIDYSSTSINRLPWSCR
jgi:hypothetical protein